MITNKNGGQWVESGSKKIAENILEHDDDVKAQDQNILNANTTWKSEFGKKHLQNSRFWFDDKKPFVFYYLLHYPHVTHFNK